MKKGILLIGVLAAAILLSGCIEPPACGNGICENGETWLTCSADCGELPPTPVCGNGIIETGEECDESYCKATSQCLDCECVPIEEPACVNPTCVDASECPGFVGSMRIGESYTPICENGCCGFDYTPPTEGNPIQPNNPVPPGPINPPGTIFPPLQPIQ
jgi:hypothetical protein